MTRRAVQYEPNATLRYCDLCGARYRNTDLIQGTDRLWRCRAFCAPEPSMIDVDRAAASAHRQREAPQPPYGQAYGMAESWMTEAAVFNYVTTFAPWPGTGPAMNSVATPPWSIHGAGFSVAAGESILYLYAIVTEGKRPLAWRTLATSKIAALADYLVANQSKAVTLIGGSYGALIDAATLGFTYMFNEARAALGVLRAYQLTGKRAYLDSVRASARFLVSLQALDKLNLQYTTLYGAGTRFFYGAWPYFARTNASSGNDLQLGMYASTTFACLEFLTALLAVDGDKTYGDASSGAFASNPAMSLSSSIAAGRAFWSTPQNDAVLGPTLGFSSATPYEAWNPSNFFAGNVNLWTNQIPGQRNGRDVALALRSLYVLEGASAQFTDIYGWSQAASVAGIFKSGQGVTSRIVLSPLGPGSFWYPASAGCLAPVMTKPNLDAVKLALTQANFVSAATPELGVSVPALYDLVNLNGDTSPTDPSVVPSVVDTAIFGNCFRYGQSYAGVPNG